MKHKNVGLKAKLREQTPPAEVREARAETAQRTVPTTKPELENPEEVELLLKMRRQKFQDEAVKLPPPRRDGMMGELRLGDIITGWFDITPELAMSWLDYNLHNRKVNRNKVASFARQILTGDFIYTHQGIAFNREDELIDGQHTLKAIILTGKTVRRMVTFGLPKKPEGKNYTTMDVIDVGGRSVADQLKISHGITESGPKKQICIALAALCYGARTRALSVGQVLPVLAAFETSIEFVLNHRAKEKGLRQIGVLAGYVFAHAATTLQDKGSVQHRVEQLFAELNTGAGLVDAATFKKNQAAGKPMRPVEHLHYFLTSPENVFFNKSMNRCIAEVTLQVIYSELHKATTKELVQAEVGVKWFAAKQKARVEKIAAMFQLPK